MISYKKILSILIVALITVSQAYAVELPPAVEHLVESSDYEAVKDAGQDICNLVNSLYENNLMAPEEIRWDHVYKIYVDASDLFSLASHSKEDIIASMEYIWCYMDEIDGRDVRVTISRAAMPDHDLVEDGVITEEEYSALAAKAGSWTAPEAEIDTDQTLENLSAYLEGAGISSESDLVLIGGTPKVRTLFAITFAEDNADQIIPLTPIGAAGASDSELAARDLGEDEGLAAGKAYDFASVAQMLNALPNDAGSESDGGSGFSPSAPSEIPVVLLVAAVIIMLAILLTAKRKNGKTQGQ